ncbi:thioredoxin family protein [Leuconostoc gasicomitatum]|uniref:thioredoxin family protein n=1 Tax=Leuconostoc gasicomitatum TaxID=115778 RepID=UPI0007DFEFB1|nr:thioredoxin family protein [Leuconostoc gasicomitatum]CUW10887.1 Thiol-disulfide isomerase and thioredoxin [Leuconostoc gasicomitatum]
MTKMKKGAVVSGILAVFANAIVLGGAYMYQNEINNGYPDTRHVADKINSLSRDSQKTTVLVFHKPGCSDCKKARSTIKKAIHDNQNKINYIVINVNKDESQTYVAKYGVTQVPTVIVLKGDRVVDSTSSTNSKTIGRVTAGEKR